MNKSVPRVIAPVPITEPVAHPISSLVKDPTPTSVSVKDLIPCVPLRSFVNFHTSTESVPISSDDLEKASEILTHEIPLIEVPSSPSLCAPTSLSLSASVIHLSSDSPCSSPDVHIISSDKSFSESPAGSTDENEHATSNPDVFSDEDRTEAADRGSRNPFTTKQNEGMATESNNISLEPQANNTADHLSTASCHEQETSLNSHSQQYDNSFEANGNEDEEVHYSSESRPTKNLHLSELTSSFGLFRKK